MVLVPLDEPYGRDKSQCKEACRRVVATFVHPFSREIGLARAMGRSESGTQMLRLMLLDMELVWSSLSPMKTNLAEQNLRLLAKEAWLDKWGIFWPLQPAITQLKKSSQTPKLQ